MKHHVETIYSLDDTSLIVTAHFDGIVALHAQDYTAGTGFCLRLTTAHLESCRELVRFLEIQLRSEQA